MHVDAVWRIQSGEHGWIREIVDGHPIVTGMEDEAWQYPTARDAQQAADSLPASPVPRRIVPGPARPRHTYYNP